MDFLSEIREDIELQTSSHFNISNIRACIALPKPDFGPTAWHKDGSSQFVRKILIYLYPMNEEKGTFEYINREGQQKTVETNGPAAVLFDSSILLHRGRAAKDGEFQRPMLEISIIPTNEKKPLKPIFAGQNSRIPKVDHNNLPANLKTIAERQTSLIQKGAFQAKQKKKISLRKKASKYIRSLFKGNVKDKQKLMSDPANHIRFANLGGGPKFQHAGWVNFDEVDFRSIGSNLILDDNTILPVSANTLEIVYSSHCFEHLTDEAVVNLLNEAGRVMAEDGSLVLKIPDFDSILENHRTNNNDFFARQFNLDSIAGTWPLKGIEDNITSRASYIFAGYWNNENGNPFDNTVAKSPGAYNGPAPIPLERHLELLKTNDPHNISKELCAEISKQDDFCGFNHRNAWGKMQLSRLLESNGFEVISTDTEEILQKFSNIPGIIQMKPMSLYIWAKRRFG